MKQNNKERKIFITKVKRFARSKAGLAKIGEIAPEVAEKIRQQPEILDICQRDNDFRVAGNYLNSIWGKPFYSGSSGNAYLRVCEHVYNFLTDATAYGGTYKSAISSAYFKVYATGIESKQMREFIEFSVIERMKPVLQWTDPNSSEYGQDKAIPIGKTRETMRPDVCINVPLRFKRFKEAQAEAARSGGVK